MPIIKSAKKRVKTAHKAAIRNNKTKRSLKTAIKQLHASIAGGAKTTATDLSKAQSEVDKAAKKNVIHKNKAARKKSQLAKAAKAAGIKPAAKAKAAPKAVAKKPAAKKVAPAKKAAPAKKPATAKKPAAKK